MQNEVRGDSVLRQPTTKRGIYSHSWYNYYQNTNKVKPDN